MTEKKKEKSNSKITTEKCREFLRVNLTDKEVLEAARRASTALLKRNRLEIELEGIKKRFKADIEAESIQMQINSQLVEDGYAYQNVDCVWTMDWEKGTKTLTRSDTSFAIKKDVKIEPSERQTTAL